MQMKEKMINRTVTGDESWVHHYQPESNCASMRWKLPSSHSTKKLANFQKRGENVNSELYCEVLLKHRDAICRKHPGQLTRGVLLHHNNATQATQERIQELR
jgi:hypothetical protein